MMPRRKQPSVNWSSYQQAIFDWVETGSGHALVNAVAGSGKTTTLEEIVNRIPRDKKIAVLAFNTHMAAELERRLPKRITVTTIHRMGMYLLTRHLGQPFQCNETKYPDLINEAIQQMLKLRIQWERDPELQEKEPIPPPQLNHPERSKARELETLIRSYLKQIIHYLQITLTPATEEGIHSLIHHFALEVPPGSLLTWLMPWPEQILQQGRLLATESLNIGLDDLLWLPHVLNLQPKTKDWVLVDEAQDLSRAQLALVLKLKGPSGRMVFVGDQHQAIFGFAGSDAESWNRIREAIDPLEFPLSITYRCPRSHVQLASQIVPQLEARPEAPEGEVRVIHPRAIKHQVQLGDLILCRFTAPLISLCLKLVIQHGIPAKVRGRDIGKMLITLAHAVAEQFPERFPEELRDHVEAKVEKYDKEGKTSAIESLRDRALALTACFEAFGEKCRTITDFCHRISGLFDDEAAQSQHVILATIHRSKGDEADRVFLLKSDCMPTLSLAETSWQRIQEWNLLYVALTRAKQTLFLVPMPKHPDLLPELLEHPHGGISFDEAPSYHPPAPPPRARSQLQVGDICRYRGPEGAMNVTCRGRDLRVLAVKGQVATVNALPDYFHKHGWIHPHDIEIRHLRRSS